MTGKESFTRTYSAPAARRNAGDGVPYRGAVESGAQSGWKKKAPCLNGQGVVVLFQFQECVAGLVDVAGTHGEQHIAGLCGPGEVGSHVLQRGAVDAAGDLIDQIL